MSGEVTRISLPDGTPVWARISHAEGLPGHPPEPGDGAAEPGGSSYSSYSSYTDTGFGDRVAAHVDSLRGLITGVAGSLADGLREARPDEVSVTFGIELTARSGKVIGLLADGETKGALTVTLTWRGGPPDDLRQAE